MQRAWRRRTYCCSVRRRRTENRYGNCKAVFGLRSSQLSLSVCLSIHDSPCCCPSASPLIARSHPQSSRSHLELDVLLATYQATSRDYTKQAKRTRLPALREVIKAKSARVEHVEKHRLADNPRSPSPPPRPSDPPLRSFGRPQVRSRHRLGLPLKPGASLAQRILYAKSMAAPEMGRRQDREQAEKIFKQLCADDLVSAHGTATVNLAAATRRALGLPSPEPPVPTPPPTPPTPFMHTLAAVPRADWHGRWFRDHTGERMNIDFGKLHKTKVENRHLPQPVCRSRPKLELAAVSRESSPEPEPEPVQPRKRRRRKVKTGWHTIDVSDLVRDRLILRHVITCAVEDGEVSRPEMRDIYKILARTQVSSEKIARVKTALEDGHLDEDDRSLLLSFVPPEPRADWKAAVQLLEREKPLLTTVFRYYSSLSESDIRATAAAGGSGDSIRMLEWRVLCSVLRLPGLAAGDAAVEQVFIRSIQDRSPIGVDYFEFENLEEASYAPTAFEQAKVKASRGNAGREAQTANGMDGEMQLREFISAVVRLGVLVSVNMGIQASSFVESTKRVVEEHLRPFALHSIEKDNLAEALMSDEVQSFLSTGRGAVRETVLRPLFMKYSGTCRRGATAKRRDAATKKAKDEAISIIATEESQDDDRLHPTMSQSEFLQLLSDSKLIDKRLTGRECKALFIRVNLDDELNQKYQHGEDGAVWVEQEEDGATPSSAVMEYEEFEEVIARIAYEKEESIEPIEKKASVALPAIGSCLLDGRGWSGTPQELCEMILRFVEKALRPMLPDSRLQVSAS